MFIRACKKRIMFPFNYPNCLTIDKNELWNGFNAFLEKIIFFIIKETTYFVLFSSQNCYLQH